MIPGTYKAKCTQAMLCQKEKGTEYIGAVLEIVEGPATGETITASLWWTEKTQERTKKDLQVIGWDNGFTTGPGGECVLTGVGAVDFPIGVAEREFEGKKRLEVAWVGSPPVGISTKDRLTLGQAKGFMARLGGKQVAGSDLPF
jgi:hypothetical protein